MNIRWYHAIGAMMALLISAMGFAANTPVDDLQLDLLPIAKPKQADQDKPFVVFMTGDGGWAELDKRVSGHMVHQGMPVVGWSTLTYFWKEKTPEQTTKDLVRILDYYSKQWHRNRVLLIGYSFGAEIVPFVINRLPAEYRQMVVGGAMFVPSTSSDFVIHVSDWVGNGSQGKYPTLPEVQQIHDVPLLCLYSEREDDDLCPLLSKQVNITVTQLMGGHNFGKQYGLVSKQILTSMASVITPKQAQ